MSGPEVLALYPPPEREDSLRSVSLALLRVRASGATCKDIAAKIGCHFDTVEAASNERSMLGFDSIARLAFHYPETRPFIEALWRMGPVHVPTAMEKIAQGQDLIRQGAAEMEREQRAERGAA